MRRILYFLILSFLFSYPALSQTFQQVNTTIGKTPDIIININGGETRINAGNLLGTGVLETTFSNFAGNAVPMSIAFDGTYYWVVGGGFSSGDVAQLDVNFNLITTQNVGIDFRSIFYDPIDGEVYAKNYGLDLLRLHTNPFDGGYDVVFTGIFQDLQSKVCVSSDGSTMFDEINGSARSYDFATGNVINTFTLDLQHDLNWPRGNLLAHSGTYLLTFANNTVYAYSPTDGSFIASSSLASMPASDEWSMCYTNGMFFVTSSDDATWYAWTIDEGVIPVELTSFTATANNGNVQLNWSTATETNNQGFEVQRKNGNNEFKKVGFVGGHGTTTETQTYSFIDEKVTEGTYTYRLRQIDFDGSFDYSDEVNVEVTIPLEFALEQNYPNPFNPSTVIKYYIPEKAFVSLFVYNLLGKKVAALVNGIKKAGRYEVTFNASNLPSGVYIYSLKGGSFNSVKKMILMK